MLVDIHSHKFPTTENWVVYNVPMVQAKAVFSSDTRGFFSVGFHPWLIDAFSEECQGEMKLWVDDRRLVAVGECGFDKNSKILFDRQKQMFEMQVALSEEKQKPLIIHCVGYFNELLELKKQWNPQQMWIIHGFRGKPQLAEQVLKSGCSLSFGEFFNPESVKLVPLEKLFIETDESNMPLEKIYEQVAKAKGCDVHDLLAGESLLKKKFHSK